MTKLTIALDEAILERAQDKASQQGTSLDILIQSYLETYAGDNKCGRQAVETLLDLSRKTTSGSGGRRWTRDELHAR
jgi:hypothetical protein